MNWTNVNWTYAALALGALLLVVAALALLGARRRRRAKGIVGPAAPSPEPEPSVAIEAPAPRRETATPAAPAPRARDAATAAAPTPAQREALAAKISAALVADDQASLCQHYLDLARLDRARGDETGAGDSLLRAIRIAATIGATVPHAEARLELGDLARASGDLTTACEHWQIARGLFYDLKQVDRLAQTEARMQSNGCPTDWVLNDF